MTTDITLPESVDPILRCTECGHEIGQLIRVNKRVWLRVKGCEAQYIHGRCENCLKIFHFDSGDYQFADLLLRIKHVRINKIK